MTIGPRHAGRAFTGIKRGERHGDILRNFLGGLGPTLEHLGRLTMGHTVEIIASVHRGPNLRRALQSRFAAPTGNVIGRVFNGGILGRRHRRLLDVAHVKERQGSIERQRIGHLARGQPQHDGS